MPRKFLKWTFKKALKKFQKFGGGSHLFWKNSKLKLHFFNGWAPYSTEKVCYQWGYQSSLTLITQLKLSSVAHQNLCPFDIKHFCHSPAFLAGYYFCPIFVNSPASAVVRWHICSKHVVATFSNFWKLMNFWWPNRWDLYRQEYHIVGLSTKAGLVLHSHI